MELSILISYCCCQGYKNTVSGIEQVYIGVIILKDFLEELYIITTMEMIIPIWKSKFQIALKNQ